MAVREVLRMGDPRLLREGAAGRDVRHAGAARLLDGHEGDDGGAERRGPRRAADRRRLQVVIFGVDHNPRYPDAEAVPLTVLINPS